MGMSSFPIISLLIQFGTKISKKNWCLKNWHFFCKTGRWVVSLTYLKSLPYLKMNDLAFHEKRQASSWFLVYIPSVPKFNVWKNANLESQEISTKWHLGGSENMLVLWWCFWLIFSFSFFLTNIVFSL